MLAQLVGNRVMRLMEKNEISIEELAKKMNMKLEKLESKLQGKEEFYLDEMIKIKDIFNLNTKQSDELFFKDNIEI